MDPQDPLPESTFTWRRTFSYTVTVALLGLLGWIIYRLGTASELADTAFWILVLLWWVVTYYMVAPSAEQIARIIQAARVMRTVAEKKSAPASEDAPKPDGEIV